MYSVRTSSYYLLAVATVLTNIAALGVVAYQYTQSDAKGVLASLVLGAFGTLWGIASLIVISVAAMRSSSRMFAVGSLLVLLTAVVSLGAAIGAGYDAPDGGILQGVSTALFTVLVVMYTVLAFSASESMLQAQREMIVVKTVSETTPLVVATLPTDGKTGLNYLRPPVGKRELRALGVTDEDIRIAREKGTPPGEPVERNPSTRSTTRKQTKR